MSEQIYVLRLQGNKFYVGMTRQPIDVRVAEHRTGRGSEWTRRHHVLGVVSYGPSNGMFSEDSKVLELMAVHGIDAVRGGSYSQVDLTPGTKEGLERQIRHANGECLSCGSPGHFVKDCPRKRSAASSIDEESDSDDEESDSEAIGCSRCGRANHRVDTCVANWHIDGYQLEVAASSFAEESDSDDVESDSEDEECDSDGGYGDEF